MVSPHRQYFHLEFILLFATLAAVLGGEPPPKPRLVPRPVPGLPVLPEQLGSAKLTVNPAPRNLSATKTPGSAVAPQSSQARILSIQRASAAVPQPPSPASKSPEPPPSSDPLLIVTPLEQGSPVRVISKAEAERLIQSRSDK